MQTIDEVDEHLAETLEEIRKDTEERAESYRRQIEEVVVCCYIVSDTVLQVDIGIPWTPARAEGAHRVPRGDSLRPGGGGAGPVGETGGHEQEVQGPGAGAHGAGEECQQRREHPRREA